MGRRGVWMYMRERGVGRGGWGERDGDVDVYGGERDGDVHGGEE